MILLWSAVGGQLLTSSCSEVNGQVLTSSCCGQGLVVSYEPHLAGVRGTSSCSCQGLVVSYLYLLAVATGWWSAMNTFFERTLSQRFREKEQRLVFIHALIHLPAIKALAV